MIIALMTILFFGGGDSAPTWPLKDVVKKIEINVVDEDRAQAAETAARDINRILKNFGGQYGAAVKNLRKVHTDYDATAADYDGVFRPLQFSRHAMQENLIRARLRLKESLTREEWEKIFVIENIEPKAS